MSAEAYFISTGGYGRGLPSSPSGGPENATYSTPATTAVSVKASVKTMGSMKAENSGNRRSHPMKPARSISTMGPGGGGAGRYRSMRGIS